MAYSSKAFHRDVQMSRRTKDGWAIELGIQVDKLTQESSYFVISSNGNMSLFTDSNLAFAAYNSAV